MSSEDSFPRLTATVTAFHWTATFGVLAASALTWRPDGAGPAVSRLLEPFLSGALAGPDAAFAFAVVFSMLTLAFLWMLVTALASGRAGSKEIRDVAQLAYAGGIAGLSVVGGFAAAAGSTQALALSSALIAALFASALAVNASQPRRSLRASAAIARAMAARAAEQSSVPRFAGWDSAALARKDT